MFHRILTSAAAVIGFSLAAASDAAAQAKFVRVSPDGTPEVRVLGSVGLPQVGSPVPDGPKRIRARISDETLRDYARASLMALGVYEKYEKRVRKARDSYEARMIASSANRELAAMLDRSEVMDHRTFQAMNRALNSDKDLARRARAVALEVLPEQTAALVSQPSR